MTDGWQPEQYARFRAERSQPFFDLLTLVRPRRGMRVVDLGCGTGELTRTLHERLGARETSGIDASPEMLRSATADARDGLRFERGDIAAFAADGTYDLVFSNAALHWVPDHDRLFARLARALAPGGQLAVQVPANQSDPSHTVAFELAGEEPFRTALGGMASRQRILAPEAYALLLARLGFAEQHVRLQVYLHELPARDAVVDWMKGAMLTDYRERLPATLYEQFVARYHERLVARLDDTRPFLFPFKRILLWAAR
jgi:trans-aconitate 2-methyltransferase